MRAAACLLCLWLCALPALAQPVVTKLMPPAGKAGGTLVVMGQGFGTDRKLVKVFFGPVEGRVVAARDGSLAVSIPWEAPARCQLRVEVAGVAAGELPFECLPSVRLSVGKNPLPVGETTEGEFRAYHTDRPVTIEFENESPGIVTFQGGDRQVVRTCGGEENVYRFTVVGRSGPRLYDVGYRWSLEASELVRWTLPWNRVDFSSKQRFRLAPVWRLPWDRLDLTRKG